MSGPNNLNMFCFNLKFEKVLKSELKLKNYFYKIVLTDIIFKST